jgi:hypothetical protein
MKCAQEGVFSHVEFSAAGLMVPAPMSAPSPFVCVVYMVVDGATNHAGRVRLTADMQCRL